MRMVWLTATLVIGVCLGVVVGSGSSRAQKEVAAPQRSYLQIQVRGTPKSNNDSVRGVLLEHDRPKVCDLLIIGSKGKGQFTCEIRSTDHALLFAIQKAITEVTEISVNCANAVPSARGGAMIDLDDPKGGSFILGTNRQNP